MVSCIYFVELVACCIPFFLGFFYGIGLLLFISCVELISCPIILVLMQSCVPLKEHTGGRGHLSHLSPGDAGGGEFDQV